MRKSQYLSTQSSLSLGIVFLLTLLQSCALTAFAQAPAPDSPQIEARTHALLAWLKLQQKIELWGSVDEMFTLPDPAIDLPHIKMSDGPKGVGTGGTDHRLCWRSRAGRYLGSGTRRQSDLP